jgi:hypothetical protein
VADAAFGSDYRSRARVRLQLRRQRQHLHVDAAVADVFADARGLQQLLRGRSETAQNILVTAVRSTLHVRLTFTVQSLSGAIVTTTAKPQAAS